MGNVLVCILLLLLLFCCNLFCFYKTDGLGCSCATVALLCEAVGCVCVLFVGLQLISNAHIMKYILDAHI